ncbi:MAG: hypothetical protein PHH82_04945, partial [Candidatus ainarchaeum sp.]|nr:hypothetical protein [Candidatus ainarchaeum sp.]
RDVEHICNNLQPKDFKDKEDKINYASYLATKKMAVNMLPELSRKIEDGFGIAGENEQIEKSYNESFHKTNINEENLD